MGRERGTWDVGPGTWDVRPGKWELGRGSLRVPRLRVLRLRVPRLRVTRPSPLVPVPLLVTACHSPEKVCLTYSDPDLINYISVKTLS